MKLEIHIDMNMHIPSIVFKKYILFFIFNLLYHIDFKGYTYFINISINLLCLNDIYMSKYVKNKI